MTKHYEILGVDRNATPKEIKDAYWELARKWHPDSLDRGNSSAKTKEEAEEMFKKISDAYQRISGLEDDQSEEWEEIIKESGKGIVEQKIENTILDINEEFKSSRWKVTEEDLDSILWNSFSNWHDKVRSLRTIDDLDSFRKQIFSAIRKKDKEKENHLLKEETIRKIKEELSKNSLIARELVEEDQNYEEEIRKLNEENIWQTEIIEKRVKENVDEIIRKKNSKITYSMSKESSTLVNLRSLSLLNPMNWLPDHPKFIEGQKYLDRNYPENKRSEVRRLVISNKNLKDWVDLSGFTNLEYLDCSKNQLNHIILPNSTNLQKLFCRDNLLVGIDFTASSSEKLTLLDLTNNQFQKQDLSCLAKFIQLKELYLGADNYENICKGIYNQWTGSLEPLKNLVRLEKLDIRETNIDQGLEYLPISLKEIKIGGWQEGAGCHRVADQLGTYHRFHPYAWTYDFLKWRKDNPNWVETIKKVNRLEEENQKLKQELENLRNQQPQIQIPPK